MQQLAHQSYYFEGFSLDLTRGCLLRGDQEIKLRPKSFAALSYLVAHGGRLISKDELIEAVWPGTAVTDNSLVQCLKEVREALGDNSQQYIKTVPRRGYIFDAKITDSHSATPPPYTQEVEAFHVVIDEQEQIGPEENRHEQYQRVQPAAISPRPTYRWVTNKKVLAFTLLGIGLIAPAYYLLFPSSPASPRSIAILPFKPLNQDSRDEYLQLGMADALITKLTNVNQIVVRPTSAVRKYADQEQDAVTVGRELRVESVLEGSIQKLGDRLRVTVQLLRVSDGRPLWAEKFDESFTNIFGVQDAISERVAEALALRLTGEERRRLAKRYTEKTEAYQLYLRGRHFWEKRTKEDLLKAIEYFERAIAVDPDYALAYAGVAHCYGPLGYRGHLAPSVATPKMKAAATRALEIDDSLAEAHTAMGAVKAFHEWDWAAAEREFKRAIELNPYYPTAHQWYGLYLEAMGRHDENLAERRRAQELDPLNLSINSGMGTVFYYSGQFDRAIEVYQKTLELDPNFEQALHGLGEVYEQKGMYQEAIAEFQKSLKLPVNIIRSKQLLAHAYAVAGQRAEALRIEEELRELSKTQFVSPFYMALIHAGLGDKDRAMEWLERAYEERDPPLNHVKVEPRLKSLSDDPRFQDLLRRMRLV